MRMRFHLLKRWDRKEETQNEYYRSVGRVLDHLNEHLDERLDVETLAGIARISFFHFFRVFKAVIGENVGDYGLRLRMDYVALQFRATQATLEQLVQKTGYNGASALSNAFKKYYGTAPFVFRINAETFVATRMSSFGFPELNPDIRRLESIPVIYNVVPSRSFSGTIR
jgi:AraC family transcriptional regulator